MNFAVVGNPISHSLSPRMHLASFKALHLAHTYCKIQLDSIVSVMSLARGLQLDGFNVTLPFKESVVECLDEIHVPEGITAVNTVKIEDGKFIGYNTDIYGILRDFQDKDIQLLKKRILILGYGGLGKTLAHVLRALEGTTCQSVTVANRSLREGVDIQASSQEMLDMLGSYDVVINTTKIGTLDDPELSMEASKVFDGYFYDCTPRKSRIASRIQQETNGKACDGLGMLVHQGAKSFEIWTGMQADIAAMKKAVDKDAI